MEKKVFLKENREGYLTCDIGLTVHNWVDILLDSNITTQNYRYSLMCFYNENNHASTCKFVGDKYFKYSGPNKFNSWITHFGQRVVKHTNCNHVYDDTQKERFWPVIMWGKDIENGLFEWRIRPEIVQAIECLGWNKGEIGSFCPK